MENPPDEELSEKLRVIEAANAGCARANASAFRACEGNTDSSLFKNLNPDEPRIDE
jgi:hypothetical protein